MNQPWSPTAEAIATLLSPLRSYARVVLAVSGGSDSTALLHLAARWVDAVGNGVPSISVATVDHGLRPGSHAEAQLVCGAARALGFKANVLTLTGAKPVHGVQQWARERRYALLAAHALANDLSPCAIVAAHTRDDQAETLLMRLARGSGPDGLQGMRPVRDMKPFDAVHLVRPLLSVSRAQLQSFLSANGVSWFDDPSNQDRRFERVRLRQATDVINGVGLTAEKMALAAQRQQRTVDALDSATDALAAAALDIHHGAFASIAAELFRSAPAEIRIRLMGRVLAMFGGSSGAAELAQLERLVLALSQEPATRVTLGGCEIRACNREIRVFREPGRLPVGSIDLKPGDVAIWDDRFSIRIKGDAHVTVRSLDMKSAAWLRNTVNTKLRLPVRAAATLPSVWFGNALISIGGVPTTLFEGGSSGQADAMVEMRFLFEAGAS